jgi:amidase
MTDLCYEPAHRLAAMLRDRKVSALELLGQFEARLARVNPAINAVVATNFDAARERARAADAAIARGEWWGPLHGLPMTIKDSYEVAGMPTVCGAPTLKDYRPQQNAVAVQRLIDAGANVFGKTNTPLYASDVQTFNKVYGTTRNPWNPERTPGGSSGGAAAALAAGLTPLELGSDIGGSIRTPAHFCGVFGHKPSFGLVPERGHIPPAPGTLADMDMTVAGPLARSAEDLALALRIVAGPDALHAKGWRVQLPPARPAKLADFRVHAWLDDPYCPCDAPMRAVLEAAVDKLRQAGCAVGTGAPAGISLAEVYEDYFLFLAAVFAAGLPDRVLRRAAFRGRVAHWFGRDRINTVVGFGRRATLSHREWLRAEERRERLRLKLEGFFGGVDVLLMPVSPTAAPPHNQAGNLYERTITVNGAPQPYGTQFVWISLATLARLPATSVPAGRTADGLPVGLQVVGAHLDDLTTIEFSRLASEVLGGFVAPPLS